jgi:thioredoxin reductase
VFDESGFNPQFDTSDNIELNGDVLIITVGQGPERATLQKEDLLDEKGMLAVDPLTLQSWKKEWVFMGGDLRRIGFMAEAMKEGLVAAESIERYLRGLDIQEGRKIDFESPDIPLRRYYRLMTNYCEG